MNKNKSKSISLSCLAIFIISTNALADKTGAPKAPVIPSSSQLKAITPPASKAVQSIPAGAPTRKITLPPTKQAAPAPKIPVKSIKRNTVKLPTGKKPAVSFKVPKATTKSAVKIPTSSNISSRLKPGASPNNAVGKKTPPATTNYQNLGKTQQSLGTARIAPGRVALPGHGLPGHNMGIGNTSGVKTNGQSGQKAAVGASIGNLKQPTVQAGRESTRQSQETGNTFGKGELSRDEVEILYTGTDNEGNEVIYSEEGEGIVADPDHQSDESLSEITGAGINQSGGGDSEDDEITFTEAESEADKAQAESEAAAEAAAAEACRNGGENCVSSSGSSNTSVPDDEPDGTGATADDVTLTGNGADTTGGVNQGGEQQASGEGGGAIRQIAGPNSHISDFDGREAVINANDLGRLKVNPDVTGGIREGIDN